MRIELDEIVIRDFAQKDAADLYRIVQEKEIYRFMRDWADNASKPEDYYGYINWLQSQKDSTDVYKNKRYAIALRETDEMIGMVGMGLEENVMRWKWRIS